MMSFKAKHAMGTSRFRLIAVLLLLTLISVEAFSLEAPRVLFHWTSARGLQRWADSIVSAKDFVLKPIDDCSSFLSAYPQFRGTKAIFAWVNVVTGMGSFSSLADEWYARENKVTGDAARLVVIVLKRNVPIEVLDTRIDFAYNRIVSIDPRGKSLHPGSGVGLVLHRMIDNASNKVMLQEYILFKRGFIESISADPKQVAPFIHEGLLRLGDSRPFQPQELHFSMDVATHGFNSASLRRRVYEVLDRAYRVPPEKVPPFFRSMPLTY